jgi:hypothetical protein
VSRGKCEHCGNEIIGRGLQAEIHHIVPFSSGGSDNYHNLIVLCPNCHSKAVHIHKDTFRMDITYRLPKQMAAKYKSLKNQLKPKTRAKKAPTEKSKPKKNTKPKSPLKRMKVKKSTTKINTRKKTVTKKPTTRKTSTKKTKSKKK